MPDLTNYPVQGKLRIRRDSFGRDVEYIRANVGYLSEPELKSVPGYDFLKFWYADFAATQEQWATLAPEMDKRNILVTLYEAPVLYLEALAEEEKQAEAQKPRHRIGWVYNSAAVLLFVSGAVLISLAYIDWPQCIIVGLVALGMVLAGQVHRIIKANRNTPEKQP